MPRSTKETWAKRVQHWLVSGRTAKEYASEIGVNPRTLIYWKWKLNKDRAASPSSSLGEPAPRFVELTSALLTQSPTLELVVGKHIIVRVPPGFDAETLRQVFAALEIGT